jgi:hypothetical protein
LNYSASITGGARIQSSCIESANSLVKQKVIVDDEKSEKRAKNFRSGTPTRHLAPDPAAKNVEKYFKPARHPNLDCIFVSQPR